MDATLIDQALAARPGPPAQPPPARLVVGFSGGLDSTVLLQLARQWRHHNASTLLLALHINHQLHPHADDWQWQCAELCKHWQVPFAAQAVTIDRAQASLEQSARAARYAVFHQHCQPGDVLLLAHHRDDQVETLLQRLLRGSGPLGLGGMGLFSQQQGLTIVRPLLDIDRADLEQHASEHQLRWINDPSNADSRFERNFLRHDALPLLRSRWPQLNQTLARSARLNREAAELLDELAQSDQGELAADGGLPLARLSNLSEARARNLIRYWLRQQGASMPSEVQLQRVLDEIVPAAADARPELVWGGQAIRRYQDALFCVQDLPPPAPDPLPFDPSQPQQTHLKGALVNTTGQGTAFSRTALQTGSLTLRFRQGGETAKPAGRHTRSLKQWLQDYRVPPWWRDHWPILYANDQLAGLPGLFACDGFQPADPDDTLWLDWQPPRLNGPSR